MSEARVLNSVGGDPSDGLHFGIPVIGNKGVVIAQYSGRLSRVFAWDMDTDTFTPGQFVKARVTLETLSPDGQYFGYRAVKYGKEFEAYSAIAKAPCFTALAIAFHPTCSTYQFRFREDGSLQSARGFTEPIDRIVLDCPFEMLVGEWIREGPRSPALRDEARQRTISVQGWTLVATMDGCDKAVVLGSFDRQPFVAIESPDWAKVW